MQDIGACRAILPNLAAVDAVRRRVERQKSEVVRIDDYNEDVPQADYRAFHIVVPREHALTEIQLRTDLDAFARDYAEREGGQVTTLEYRAERISGVSSTGGR